MESPIYQILYSFYFKILSIHGCYFLYALFIKNILRIVIDRKRPSEKYDLTPIDGSKKTGHSFPSIHVAMSISIALAVLHFGPNMGLLLSVLAGTITVTRLISGVHYITDILASITIALLINFI